MDRLLTPKEVAEILRVSPNMVRDLVRKGTLPALREGRPKKPRVMISEAAFYEYLESTRVIPKQNSCEEEAVPEDSSQSRE